MSFLGTCHHFAHVKNKEVNLDLFKIEKKMEKSHKILQNLIFFKWGNTKILKHSLESKLFKPSCLEICV